MVIHPDKHPLFRITSMNSACIGPAGAAPEVNLRERTRECITC